MHATQNDFILLDGFSASLPASSADLASRICCRRRHIGADGVLFLRPPADAAADVDVEIRNADGSAAAMCGNGARCVAVWMHRSRHITDSCRMRFSDRIVQAAPIGLTETGGHATVNMGPAQVLTDERGASRRFPDGQVRSVWNVDTGNLHTVVFVDDLSNSTVSFITSALSDSSDARTDTNVELAVPTAPGRIRVRVRERGCGETPSCGSGACAVLAAAIRSGIARPEETWHIEFAGGTLSVEQKSSGNVHLTGPADVCFTGQFAVPPDSLPAGTPSSPHQTLSQQTVKSP